MTVPFTAWFAPGLVALLFIPGAEALADLLAWLALVFGVGIWITTGYEAAAGRSAALVRAPSFALPQHADQGCAKRRVGKRDRQFRPRIA